MLFPLIVIVGQNDHKGSDLNKAANKGSDHKGASTTPDVAFVDHHAADAASRNMRVSSSVGPVDAPSAMAIA